MCDFRPDNTLHLFCSYNDYRGADDTEVGDSWQGVSMSRDGGLSWTSRLGPGWKGYPLPILRDMGEGEDPAPAEFSADPAVTAAPGSMFQAFIASDRADKGPGGMYLYRWWEQTTEMGDPWRVEETPIQIAAGERGRFIDKDDLIFTLDPAGGTSDLFGHA